MTLDLERALLGWPLVASLVTLLGTAAFVLICPAEQTFDFDAAATSLIPLWRFAAILVFLSSPLLLFSVTTDMASVPWSGALPLVPEVLRETHAGHLFEWLLPLSFVVLFTALIPLRQFTRTIMLLSLAAGLLLVEALLTHAVDKGSFAIAVYFLHEVMVGLWFGALLALWIVARYGGPPDSWVQHSAQRVSTVALWAVVGLVITGGYTAWLELGFDAYRLLYSAYGRTLILKMIAFGMVLTIGGYNRFVLVPAVGLETPRRLLLRNVMVESVLLVGVLGLATLLANTPPPHGNGHSSHSTMAM